MFVPFSVRRSIRASVPAAAGALTLLAFSALPRVAHAQQYVYVAPPPPPPPPPPPGYAPYHEGRVVYVREREPPPRTNSFDLGIDLEGTVPVNAPTLPDGNRIQGGSGFKLRFGDQIRLAPDFRLTIEGGYAYDHLFAADDEGNSFDWDMSRIFGGVRLGFGHFVSPSIYGHVGLGWRESGDSNVSNSSGFAADAGGAIDFRFWRHLTIGAHAEYVTVNTAPYAPEWVAIGGHLDILF